MAMLVIDGFDKYGPVNTNNPGPLMLGEWAGGTNGAIALGLSSVGYAFNHNTQNSSVTRSLNSNVSRIIGGVRFNMNTTGTLSLVFYDTATAQFSITAAAGSPIVIRTGSFSGTAIATSAPAIVVGTTHYVEWDVTVGTAGAYQVWLDGTSILSGTGNTRGGTTNNYVNLFGFSQPVAVFGSIYDDLYLFDTTGTVNNAVLLTSPRVETTFPVSDSSVQFAIGASVIGSPVPRFSTASATPGANQLYLRPVTAARTMTLNSVSAMPSGTSAAINWRTVVYADNSGLPGALLGQSNVGIGTTSGTVITGNLISPVSLTAGVQYWIGLHVDTTINWAQQDTLNQGRFASITFTLGPPSSAPAMSGGQLTMTIWGAVTLAVAANFYEVNQQPPAGQYSYVYDSVVGHEDLYNFGALSVIPTAVYAVSVKSYAAKSDTGVRTMSNRLLSSGVDSGGSLTGQTLSQTFQWYATNFDTDPGTGAAWTGVGLNAAQSGFRIDS